MHLHFSYNLYPFIAFTAGIFQLVLIFYLVRLKQKSRATWFMIGFFACIFLALVSIFLTNALVFWGTALWAFQDAWVIVASVFMLLFIYHFPSFDHPREAIILFIIYAAFALLTLVYSV